MEDVCAVKVEHGWMTGNGTNAIAHSHKMHLLTCNDLSNKELFLHIFDQFFNDAHDNLLHLSAGALRGLTHCVSFGLLVLVCSWVES